MHRTDAGETILKILADTSVWIQFLRNHPNATKLKELLCENRIVCHPWIIGELALGNLGAKRAQILADLSRLQRVAVISEKEMFTLIEVRALNETGIGWVDTQLIGAALVSGCRLWTFDKKLCALSHQFDCGL